MKRSLFIYGFLASIIFSTSCQKEISHKTTTSTATTERAGTAATDVAVECGTPMVKNLYDMGGVTNWGTIEVSNDNTNIIVKITSSTYPNMLITKTTLVYGSQSHVQTAIS